MQPCVCVCLLFAHRLEQRPIVQCLVLPGSASKNKNKKVNFICEMSLQFAQGRSGVARQFVTDYHQWGSAHSALIGIRSECVITSQCGERGRERGRRESACQLPVVKCCQSPNIRYAFNNIIMFRHSRERGGWVTANVKYKKMTGAERRRGSQCRSVCWNHQAIIDAK